MPRIFLMINILKGCEIPKQKTLLASSGDLLNNGLGLAYVFLSYRRILQSVVRHTRKGIATPLSRSLLSLRAQEPLRIANEMLHPLPLAEIPNFEFDVDIVGFHRSHLSLSILSISHPKEGTPQLQVPEWC